MLFKIIYEMINAKQTFGYAPQISGFYEVSHIYTLAEILTHKM